MSNRISGVVSSITESGTIVSDIPVEQLSEAPRDDSLRVEFGGHQTVGLYDSNHQEPEMTMVASLGESGYLEVEIVGLNLCEMLGIKVGEPVFVAW